MTSPTAPTVRSNEPLSAAADASARAWPKRPDPAAAISPELALVSPELAVAARLRLPDGPWEHALRRAGVSTLRPADGEGSGARTSSSVGEACPSRAAQVGSLVRTSADPFDHEHHGRTHWWRVGSGLALATAIAVGLMSVIPGVDVRKSGNGEADPLAPSQPRDSSSAMPVETRPLLLASAGYVVSPAGSLSTDASGRRIASFTLPLRCGDDRPLRIRGIPLTGRSLRATVRAVGRAITVRLRGRVIRRDRLRGVVAAEGPECSADPVVFVARLS